MQIIIFPLMKIRVKNNFTLIKANSATFFHASDKFLMLNIYLNPIKLISLLMINFSSNNILYIILHILSNCSNMYFFLFLGKLLRFFCILLINKILTGEIFNIVKTFIFRSRDDNLIDYLFSFLRK